jgi:ribosomal protein L17
MLVVKVGYKIEKKLINKNLIRVRRFPKYSKERIEEAMKELEELRPYIEKVIEESKNDEGSNP